jgi:H+/Cl- antiporter ClcA
MKLDDKAKKTIAIVGTSALIGFLGDVVMYSFTKSENGPFKLQFPKGKALLQVVAVGIVTGIVVSYVVEKIEKKPINQ